MADATIGSLTTQDFTIECAFFVDTLTLDMYLMSKSSGTEEYSIKIDSADTDILKLNLFETGGTDRSLTICDSLAASGVIADGNWHYLSVRMDRTGGLLTCLIDNTAAISAVNVSGWGTDWRQDVTSVFCVSSQNKEGADVWDGGIDEVAIYLKAITDAERTLTYNWWKYDAVAVAEPEDYSGYWLMDDTSGDFIDSSGNAHDAAVSGTPVYSVVGHANASIGFDGSTDYGTITSSTDLSATEITVSAWIITDSATNQMILQNYNYDNTYQGGFLFRVNSDGTLFMYLANMTGKVADVNNKSANSTSSVATGTMQHVCGTYDGSNIKLYVNGVLETTVAWAGGIAYDTPTYVRVSQYKTDFNTGAYFHGLLDDIKFFGRALNGDEVSALYAAEPAIIPPVVSPVDYIAYWTMDEASGDFADSSGNGHTATAVGSPTYGATGQVSDAVTFNGSSQYATVANDEDFRPVSTKVSVSAWIKTSEAVTNGAFFCNREGVGSDYTGYHIGITDAGLIYAQTFDGVGAVEDGEVASAAGFNDGVWHHVVFTNDDLELRLYVDGSLVHTDPTSNALAYYAQAQYIRLGKGEYHLGTYSYYSGDLDDVKVYNRAISATEVATMYNDDTYVAPAVTPTDYIAYWTMDEASGTLADSSGNGHTATTYNSPTYGATGQVGDGIDFNDGSSQYADIVYDNALRLTDFTVTAWINVGTLSAGNVSIYSDWYFDGATNYRGLLCMVRSDTGVLQITAGDGTASPGVHTGITDVRSLGLTHVAFGFGAGNLFLWVNGSYEGATAWTGTTYDANNTLQAIGHQDSNGSLGYFDGVIDDLKIFDRRLGTTEIIAMVAEDTYEVVPVPEDMTSWWKMDNDSGNIDEWVFTNHLAPIGTPLYRQTGLGDGETSVYFDGVSDGFTISDQPVYRTTGKTSVSIWFKTTDVPSPVGTLVDQTYVIGNFRGYVLRLSSVGSIQCYFGDNLGGNGTVNITGTGLNDGEWHHVVATYDGLSWRGFQDGVQVRATIHATSANLIGVSAGRVGIWNQSGGIYHYEGYLDDLKLFDRAIDDNEVRALYLEGTTPSTPKNWSQHWTFDNAQTATNLCQSLAINDNLSVHVVNAGYTTGVTGQVGQAWTLNGTDNYITRTQDARLKHTTPSVSMWIKTTDSSVGLFDNFTHTPKYMGYQLDIHSSGYARVRIGDGVALDTGIVIGTTLVNTGSWTHVAFTYDGFMLSLYVNGVLDASLYYSAGIAFSGTWDDFNIGCNKYTNTRGGFFGGSLDDIKLFPRALIAEEIAAMYTADGGT